MVMRVGGLATGMDIESIVNKLMDAERMPLVRLNQDRQMLEWKRDAFRDINKVLLDFDNMMLDMKLSKTYFTKQITSSQENAVTATASTSAMDGSYQIQVTQLATAAINVSQEELDIRPDKTFGEMTSEELGDFEFDFVDGKQTFQFTTYNEDGSDQTYTFTVNENDTLDDVLNRITNDPDSNVRAFYDSSQNRVIIESTRLGKYNNNENGKEISFGADNGFFTDVLKLDPNAEAGGTNAKFTYNNSSVEFESRENQYTLNGVTFEFHNVTEGNARISISNDVEHSFNAIMDFVNKYNEVVEKLNGSQQEQVYRDYKPLTEEQKAEMSEKQIEQWEERAKSGILRRETAITNGLLNMRQSWYSVVETDDEYQSLTQIGIETSKSYLDGGKLEVDEDKLRKALRENPEAVRKLFSNTDEGNSRGLVNRLEDAVEATMKDIEKRAGKGTQTLEQYTLGKRLKDLNEQISAFEQRMLRVENRYWNQFTAMEKAIQRMNEQHMHLFSQFGG